MYFIKKITLDENKNYQSSQLVAHTNKTIIGALSLLEETARAFVKQEFGREAADCSRIIDIYNRDQISEPIIDCMLLYRLDNDSNKILVYQKKSCVIKATGWFGSTSDVVSTSFRQTHLFELEEYVNISSSSVTTQSIENPAAIATDATPITKQINFASRTDLLNELKNSPRFKARSMETIPSVVVSGPLIIHSFSAPMKKSKTIPPPPGPMPIN